MNDKKTLLLVGGRLCERAAQRLASEEWSLTGLRRRSVAPQDAGGIRWMQADLRRAESLRAAFQSPSFPPITHILYAPTPDGRTAKQYGDVYSDGLPRLLSQLQQAGRLERLERFVLVTSTAMWGPNEDWVHEDTPADQTGFRAESLLAAEAALQAALAPGVGVVLRLSGLYGEGDPGRLARRLASPEMVVPDGPGHWANRIHRDDAAGACAHLLQLDKPQPLYIGTDDHPTPQADLYDALCREFCYPPPQRRFQEPTGKRLSNARLKASGWHAQWPDMVAGYRAWIRKQQKTQLNHKT